MLDANFWQDKAKSQKIIKEKKLFEDLINSYNLSNIKLQDLDDLNELALEENNIDMQKEVSQNIKDLRLLAKKNEIKCFLSNEADSLDSYIEIHAGAKVNGELKQITKAQPTKSKKKLPLKKEKVLGEIK